MAWTYIVQRATTGEFLEWDLPLNTEGPSWELSGPGSLSGTLDPDVGALRTEDGRLLLEEWGSLIYAEADGEIRWGGLIIVSEFSGEAWTIEAAGFTTYPSGLPYLGEFIREGLDPADAVKEIWRHLQSFPDGNLGVTVTGGPTPARLGTPAVRTVPEPVTLGTVSAAEWDRLLAAGWIGRSTDGSERLYPPAGLTEEAEGAEPYQLVWYESPDCGSEIADLAKATPFDYTERHYWRDPVTRDEIVHEVQIHYPRVGRKRDDLSFVQGDNITSVVSFESLGDDFANEVVGLGAGEGRATLRRSTARRDGRLRRTTVYSDKATNSAQRMDAVIADELERRRGLLQVTSIEVDDHDNARIGSWQVGDDILVRCVVPWLGEVDVWCRVIEWSLTGPSSASLSLARSDSFRYGG